MSQINPITKVEIIQAEANRVLAEIISGETTPDDASHELWRLADHDQEMQLPLLNDFRGRAISFSLHGEYNGDLDLDEWRQEVTDLARRVLERGGISTQLILDGDQMKTLQELFAED